MRRAPEGPPAPPEVLRGPARAEWERVAPDLHRRGLLRAADQAALATYCLSWGRLVDAEEKLRDHGMVVLSPSGFPVQSPYLGIACRAEEQLLAAAAHFGMTPASRAAVSDEVLSALEAWGN